MGQDGTPYETLVEAMGDPDEFTANIYNPYQTPSFMPGPVISEKEGGEQLNTVYLIYKWRGRHDFLYFIMDQSNEVVKGYKWYAALE